jgi:hypothetical protein
MGLWPQRLVAGLRPLSLQRQARGECFEVGCVCSASALNGLRRRFCTRRLTTASFTTTSPTSNTFCKAT